MDLPATTAPMVPVPARDARGRWDLRAAMACQRRLAGQVECTDRMEPVRLVAGSDVSYDPGSPVLYAAVVVLQAADLSPVETAGYRGPAEFPYLPGFLSFRESPALLHAFRRLRRRPDLLLVDGHGRAHPRGLGIASHLGVLLDLPAIGVAKTVLVGTAEEPAPRRGSTSPLVYRNRIVGRAVRTRDRVRPVYVSVGHRVSLPTAVRWVLQCGAGYRIPEPVRQAHLAVNVLRAEGGDR